MPAVRAFDGYDGGPGVCIRPHPGRRRRARAVRQSDAHTLLWRGEPVAVKNGSAGSGTMVLETGRRWPAATGMPPSAGCFGPRPRPATASFRGRLNRPVSQAISRRLLRIEGIRPWHVTIVTAIAVAMVIALLGKGYGWP